MLEKILLFALTAIYGCQCQLEEVVKADDKFTSDVYKELSSSQKGNIVYSGLSTDMILSLLTNGANGDTKEELILALNLVRNDETRNTGFLHLTSSLNVNTEKLKVLSANKIYPAEGFAISDGFKHIAIYGYKTEVENLNYNNPNQAAGTINKWVEKNTNNKIQNLIAPNQLTAATKLVLVNTLYFSGKWLRPFPITTKGVFYAPGPEPKQVDLLKGTFQAKYRHCGYYQTKFLELDFEGGDASMTFILPDDSKNGLKNLENDLVGVTEIHDMKKGAVEITIPKFRIENKLDLIPILKKLGAQKIFTNNADLSGLSSTKNLKVDVVTQKAYIDVNANGVEAAAATGDINDVVGCVHVLDEGMRGFCITFGGSTTSVIKPEFSFNADHPFLYYIRQKKSGVLLFVGRYQG